MSAELLREAAALMRSRAKIGAPLDYPSPWRTEKCDIERYGLASIVTCHEDGSGDVTDALDDDVAEHIASWHPAVALAVADWLERLYVFVTDFSEYDEDEELTAALRTGGDVSDWPEVESALAVANAYLGGRDE